MIVGLSGKSRTCDERCEIWFTNADLATDAEAWQLAALDQATDCLLGDPEVKRNRGDR